MKTKNKIIIAISIVLVLAIIAVVLFIYNKNKQEHNKPEDVVVLKENVIVITDEVDDDLQPYKVDENYLYFKKKPKYQDNDVVVSGMTKAAPNGYIRRIIKTEELNGEFIVETEPATFLDVFEELHIDRTFTLIKGKQSPTIETQSIKTDAINISSLTKTEKENNFSIKESSDKDSDELFKVEFEGDLCEEIHIEGETTVKLWLNTKIDIDDGHITWEMTANDEVNGNILLGYSASVEDEYTKELFNAQLPNIQFMAGPVPIVITNEVSADLNVEGEIKGKIGTEIEINKSDKAGFIYTSKTNKVEDITSQEFTDGGIEWNSGTSVEVATSAGVEIGLTSLFYDCSGADISVGVAGDIDGKATLSTVDTTEEPLEGKIALSIYPYLQGGIVVEVPVIDNQLVELTLFELELKPFREKVWDTNPEDTSVNVTVEDYSLIEKVNNQGNSIGNLNESGSIARQGEWIYYNDSGYLKKELADGSKREILGKCDAHYINVVGEWIYYSDYEYKTLCKKSTDGSKTIELSDEYVDYVYVEDEWIYYKTYEDDMSILYRMNLDGSNNEKIFSEAFCVYQGRIYYQNETSNFEYQLCSVSLDGSNNIVLVDGRISYLNIDDEWIYYRSDDEDFCLYKIKIDGSERVRLLDDTEATNFIVWNEWIYYISSDIDNNPQQSMIYRINKDGTNIQYAKNIPIAIKYNVVDGKIGYIRSINERTRYCSFEEACFMNIQANYY